MKTIFSIFIIMLLHSIVMAQVVYNYPDCFKAGETYPIVRYTNTSEVDGFPIGNFYEDNVFTIFPNEGFVNCIKDTLIYYEASELDEEFMFPDANCAYLNELGFEMFLIIDENSVKTIGIQGVMPVLEMPISLSAVDSLDLLRFPTQLDSDYTDMGSLEQKFLLADFESMIPADYYDLVSSLYDSVKIYVEIEAVADFDMELRVSIQDTNSYHATKNVLREKRREVMLMDVLLRSKWTGGWSSLGTVPGISDQLPMDLPIVDTTYTMNYYAEGFGIPILSCGTNASNDSVYSMKVYNAENTDIPQFNNFVDVTVFPNPSSQYVFFELSQNTEGSLYVFNLNGNIVEQVNFKTKNIIFDAAKLTPGLYLYQLVYKSGYQQRGKFQVLR